MTGKKNKAPSIQEQQEVLDKILNAAFEQTAQKGWKALSLHDVAGSAGLNLSDLRQHIGSRSDILAIYNKRLDTRVLENLGEMDVSKDVPAKDRLFDILMERFDLMNADREALSKIIRTLNPDPLEMLDNCLRLKHSIIWMLEAAGIRTTGLAGKMRVKGLMVIYLVTLKTWLEDESPDLSSTMARLDKLLKQAEQAAHTFRMTDDNKPENEAEPVAAE